MTHDHAAFPGFASPNFTQVPDELFDVLMPQLTECELRVLLYIIRRTFGFKRASDAISLSQLVGGITVGDGRRLDHGAGVARSSAVRAIKGLLAKGVIVATRRRSAAKGNETTTYALRFATQDQPTTSPWCHGETRGAGSIVQPALVSPRNPQEREERDTDFEYSNGADLSGESTKPGARSTREGPPPGRGQEGMGEILARRRRRPGGDDEAAIAIAIETFAGELGDQASPKSSVRRAVNLFRASGIGRDRFVDLLYRARGEVRDRRRFPGRAPLPRNQMAYFFAIVEDRLGLRDAIVDPAPGAA